MSIEASVPQTPPITFGPQICGSLSGDGAAHREWIVADGRGGFASGTVAGLRTRHSHALLAVAEPTSGIRRVGLAALDLTVTLPSGERVALFTHAWRSGAVEPRGHRYLETFSLVDGLPRWRWRIGDVVIERELAMRYGHPSVAVVHRVRAAPGPVGLAVAAMCTWRDAHGTRHAGGGAPRTEQVADGVVVDDAYRIAGPGWQPAGGWHFGASACDEDHDPTEDLWHAGTFLERVNSGGAMEISAWAAVPGGPRLADRPPPASAVIAAARERAYALVTAAKAEGCPAALVLAADAFVVRGADGPDVLAGYPWLGSALGDTAAAYAGLFLDTGRADEGREVLAARARAAARSARSAASRPPTAVDAPLWLVHAVDRHVARTGDADLAAALIGPLTRVLRAGLDGPGPLSVDPADQLVRLAEPPSTGGDPAAPGESPSAAGDRAAPGHPAEAGAGAIGHRTGKPVEINALWINALGAMADLLEQAGRDGTRLRARRAAACHAFAARFRAPEGWLYDVVDGPAAAYPLGAGAFHDDPTLRPNQLLAWSLPHGPLRGHRDAAAVRAVGGALLTPLGPRTLAPAEYGYAGGHRGGPGDRDAGGQQGTVWPWLIGGYADACAAVGLPTEGLLVGLAAHLSEWGVGSVSETADGDPPHRAGGCPFSARSVAEALRVSGYAG